MVIKRGKGVGLYGRSIVKYTYVPPPCIPYWEGVNKIYFFKNISLRDHAPTGPL